MIGELTDLYWQALTLVGARGHELTTAEAVVALADLLDDRDSYTYQHSRRVAAYAEAIGHELGLAAADLELVVSAARVHDLGKIGVADAILRKPGRLTPAEAASMRQHPTTGAELLGRLSLYQEGARLVRHHHERYDGSGYPGGLAGESIPLGDRIIAVADAYDAMTSDRPYRRSLGEEQALAELARGQGSQFDPLVVAAMCRLVRRGEVQRREPAGPPRAASATAAGPRWAVALAARSCGGGSWVRP